MNDLFVHPTAIVEEGACIGAGTRVWAYAHVLAGATVGRDCNIGDHCFIEGGAIVGDDVTIKNGVAVWCGVTLGDGVFVGPGVIFTNDRMPRSRRLPEACERYRDERWLERTVVRLGTTLGAGAIVCPGVSLGVFSMVAAGAVVARTVPDHALVRGHPARVRGWVCACGERLRPDITTARFGACTRCLRSFEWDLVGLRLISRYPPEDQGSSSVPAAGHLRQRP